MRSPRYFGLSTILAAIVTALCCTPSDALTETPAKGAPSQEPGQWRTVRDATGTCRMSVPGSWTLDRDHPFMARGPNASMALIVIMDQQDPLKPLDAGERQMFGFVRILESTPQRAMYAGKPTMPKAGRPSVVVYTVEVAGRPTCSSTINLVPSQDELAKKIAATVGAVR
jgi:hypothetical protein